MASESNTTKIVPSNQYKTLETQSRIKSIPTYTAFISLVILLGGNYGLFDAINLPVEKFKEVADLILTIVIGVGVYNNGSLAESFTSLFKSKVK